MNPIASNSCRRFLLMMTAALGIGVAAPAQTLTLADGQLLLAHVDDADGEGLRVTRLDNGGVLSLSWSHLAPDCALRIKQAHSLAATEVDDLTIIVQEVSYSTVGGDQSVIGRVIGNDGTTITVQNKGVLYKIPRKDLRGAGIRNVEVPVMQVFTRDEFYNTRLAELQPGDEADKHVLFAEELLRVRDYANAKVHLELAKQKGNSRNPTKIDGLLARTTLFIEAKKERDLLDEIQAARQRGQRQDFERGLKLIAQYEKEYQPGKLKAEFDAESKRFADARQRVLTVQVANRWRAEIRTVANSKVGDEAFGWETAKEYAETKMGDDIAARVATLFKLPVDEVKQMFAARGKYTAGKTAELFGYGLGSWVLGEAAIVKGTKQADGQTQKAPKDAAQDRQIEAIARRLRQAMQQNRAAQGGGQDAEPTEEDWWREATQPERTSWLSAYYAEHGGHLQVSIAFTQPCVTCFGEGTTAEIGLEGKLTRTKCYLCHGMRWLRTFKAW
ncbi:MAG: hypothetical protein IPK26_24355 [Planctomycetes bacterium]|nr:hypothetical protein [Planctomycetota bacterium]